MNNKELIDKIYSKLILDCNKKCEECEYIDCCICVCGNEFPTYNKAIDYKKIKETSNIKSIARYLNIL